MFDEGADSGRLPLPGLWVDSLRFAFPREVPFCIELQDALRARDLDPLMLLNFHLEGTQIDLFIHTQRCSAIIEIKSWRRDCPVVGGPHKDAWQILTPDEPICRDSPYVQVWRQGRVLESALQSIHPLHRGAYYAQFWKFIAFDPQIPDGSTIDQEHLDWSQSVVACGFDDLVGRLCRQDGRRISFTDDEWRRLLTRVQGEKVERPDLIQRHRVEPKHSAPQAQQPHSLSANTHTAVRTATRLPPPQSVPLPAPPATSASRRNVGWPTVLTALALLLLALWLAFAAGVSQRERLTVPPPATSIPTQTNPTDEPNLTKQSRPGDEGEAQFGRGPGAQPIESLRSDGG